LAYFVVITELPAARTKDFVYLYLLKHIIVTFQRGLHAFIYIILEIGLLSLSAFCCSMV